ncbi:hypothetical protein EV421DRAFT_1848487, partial [Armillaria borealis]
MRHRCMLCLAAVTVALEIKRREIAMTTSGTQNFSCGHETHLFPNHCNSIHLGVTHRSVNAGIEFQRVRDRRL